MKNVFSIAVVCLFLTNLLLVRADTPSFGVEAYQHLQAFDKIGSRPAGTIKEREAADYILNYLKELGYNPSRTQFTTEVKVSSGRKKIQSANIEVLCKGATEKEYIICAHYDSSDEGNGADDNGSGVAVLLEVCGLLKGVQPKQTVRFLFFGAEEFDTAGSREYVGNMSQDEIHNVAAVLNYDSLIAGEKAYVYGDFGAKGYVRDWMLAKAESLGYNLQTQPGQNKEYPKGTTGDWGDHVAFKRKGIPYAYFEATNWDLGDRDGYTQVPLSWGDEGEIWHTRFDTLKYMNHTFGKQAQERLALYCELLFLFLTEKSN